MPEKPLKTKGGRTVNEIILNRARLHLLTLSVFRFLPVHSYRMAKWDEGELRKKKSHGVEAVHLKKIFGLLVGVQQ
jgi:hypothetical protein